MPPFSATLSIAALSSRVFMAGDAAHPHAAAVAALKVTADEDALAFSLHTHVPSTGARLTAWLDALVADDPLLVGYRLPRISQLLAAAGYDRHLAGSFNRAGRHEVMRLDRGKPTPLSVIAVRHGVQAVDEEAVMRAAPVRADVAATLALVNAVACWITYVHKVSADAADTRRREVALAQLGRSLMTRTSPAPLAAAMIGAFQ